MLVYCNFQKIQLVTDCSLLAGNRSSWRHRPKFA